MMESTEISEEAAERILETLYGMRSGMNHMEAQTVSMGLTLIISEYKLKELWSKGVLSDLAYISFALQFNPDRANLDAAQFAREWSLNELGELEIEMGWKPKRLKKRAVLNVIAILEEKGFLISSHNIQLSQLSLFD